MPAETLTTTTDSEITFNSSEFELSDRGADLLDQIDRFISRYLECSDHQRLIMSFWVLHTHCLGAAQFTPYLAIQSTEKQSGKSLCLELLSMIAADSALTTSYTASSLSRRTDDPIPTVLLDEFQATIGTRVRSKSPLLRAVLASGFQSGVGYTTATRERNLFAPKAFAGMGQLPGDIADRSISIVLEPLTGKSKVRRFDFARAAEEADELRDRICAWAQGAIPLLKARPPYSREKFPPNLSPRCQDMIEPLLEIADFIGDGWSDLIREALADAFQEQSNFELKESLLVLADIRDCFAHHGYVERLSTSDLLAWLHSRPARPWDVDGRITARRLAHLLYPFEIMPRVQRIGKTSRSRGYQLQDFIEHWQKHLGFQIPVGSQELQAVVTDSGDVEIPNKDGGCHAVTDSHAHSGGSDGLQSVLSEANGVAVAVASPVASQVTPAIEAKIANKNAACHAVTHSGEFFQKQPQAFSGSPIDVSAQIA